MKMLTFTAAVVAATLLAGGPALAQDPRANCQPSASARGDAKATARAPEKIEGKVTKVDPTKGMIIVQNEDGSTHEFKGSADTLRDYHVGDQIELTLRAEPC